MTEVQESQANSSSELEMVLEQLTNDQIRFVAGRLSTTTDKEAAENLEIKPDTVCYWKRKGAPIDDAVRLMRLDGLVVAQHVLKRNLAKASLVKVAGLDIEDDALRQRVATEIIEWAMGKATQRTDVTTKGESLNEGRLTDAQRTSLVTAVLERASDQAGGPGADE